MALVASSSPPSLDTPSPKGVFCNIRANVGPYCIMWSIFKHVNLFWTDLLRFWTYMLRCWICILWIYLYVKAVDLDFGFGTYVLFCFGLTF